MSERSAELLLEDMLESCERIIEYTQGLSFEEFKKNYLVVDAVVRNFTIIGEAAGRIPDEYKIKHDQIEWDRIRGFRNRIVHDYFGIDYQIVWIIIENNIPELRDLIKKMI
ncbi:MAG: DUF86 domain-containing protein [Bacteroidales bacterium]|nr:DUF86 domain-containing protein [Bacteroidales bacterium]